MSNVDSLPMCTKDDIENENGNSQEYANAADHSNN
jgi:hypothetical protein